MKKAIALLLAVMMMLGVSSAFAATWSIETDGLTAVNVVDENGDPILDENGEPLVLEAMTVEALDDEEVAELAAEVAALKDAGKTVVDLYDSEETKDQLTAAIAAAVASENDGTATEEQVKEAASKLTVTAAAKVESGDMLEVLDLVNSAKPEGEKITTFTAIVDVPFQYEEGEKIFPVLKIPVGVDEKTGEIIYEEYLLQGEVDANGKLRIVYPIEILQKMEGRECDLQILSFVD